MKTISMKKFFSLLLCLCMLLSMNSPAFAAEGEESTCAHGAATAPVAPTCNTPGNENIPCPVCGEPIDSPIPATDVHNYVDGFCANEGCGLAATCTKAEDCPALSHEADCLSQLCDKCGNDNHEGSCPCNKEATCPANDDAHEADCVKKLTDEANKAKIAEVNALIAALPETITVDNYASVMAQLEAIKANETEMGELWNQLDLDKLNAVINATYAANTLEGCICTAKCDDTTACVFCLSNECPKGPAVAKIGEVGYDSLDAALKAANAMTGEVTITICGNTTYTGAVALNGSYSKLNFVGASKTDSISIPSNIGYIDGSTGAAISFSNLTLRKPDGVWMGNAAHMAHYFTVYCGSSVSYSGCDFPEGSSAQGRPTSYYGCSFSNGNYSLGGKYSLWVYSNTTVTVDTCTFNGTRGVKMYAEGNAAPGNLIMKKSSLAGADDKPAIVLTKGSSITLEGNSYPSTGVLELDHEGSPNGVALSTDLEPEKLKCINDNYPDGCGVLVDGKIYTTVTDAAAVAEEGSTVTLLHDSEETVELPAGVKLDKGSFEAGGVTVAAPVAKIGDVEYGSLQSAVDAAKNGDVITLCQSVSEPVTVTQKPDVAFTIDGAGNTMSNSITVDGRSSRYPTAGLTIRNINFTGNSVTGEAFINLGVSGNNNTRYTSNVSVQGCSFSSTGNTVPCIKSYTGGDTNLSVIGCTANAGTHSLLQVDNVEGKLTISGNKVYSKNGINLNSSGNVEITGNDISVSGYAVRTGASSGTAVTPSIVLSGNTLATNNKEGDPVIVVRSTTESATITMSENSVSGNTHIGGNTTNTTINADGNYWDGEEAPKTSGTPVEVLTYYSDAERTDLVTSDKVIASIGDELYLSLQEAIADAKDGDTIKLLQDVELSSTLIIGDPNGAFNKIGITINGNDKTIKAVGTGWNDNMWLVDVTYNAAISNLTFDGNNTGCKGVQFYTSNSSLSNAVIKNISADKWGYTDYALHSNASDVALSGVSLVDCKHGHIIVDVGSNTGRTDSSINATGSVSGATVILNTPEAKATASQDGLTVLKGTDASVSDHVLVYANGSYVLIVPVAQVGETVYETLDEAIAAAAEGGTVKLLKDIDDDVTIGKNLTIDLNGNKLNGDITVASGKTLSVSEEDLAAAGSLSLADSLGDVKIGDDVIGLEDGTIAATSAGLSVTPSGSGKSYVAYNNQLVGVPAGSSLTLNADGSAKVPAGGSVVFAGSFEVPVAAESALAADGTLTLYPAEVQDYGYGKVTVTYGESAKSETVFVPAGKSLTVKADKNGNPVYDSSAEEEPIVTAGSVEKPKLSITPSRKAFYKFGLGTLSFTCNGFCDTLETVSVDGVGLNDTAYTLQRGSTIVKLKNDYLKTLALGDHTLKLTYADGQSVTATISIVNTPVTGDSSNLAIWLAVLGLSGLLCTAAVLVLKRRRA